jgi:ankyrin repeat protein
VPVRSFDRITIPAPCDADWDSMIGNDQVRFCEHCNLHVTDLSAMTRQQAMRLVASSQGRLCVRFIQRPDGGILTRTVPEKFYRISPRASRIAAGAFTATLSLSSAVAQAKPASSGGPAGARVELVRTNYDREIITDEFSARVLGTVTSSEGALIPDATVVLVDRETGEERSTTSTNNGEYFFESLPAGDYLLWVRKRNFTTSRENVPAPPNTVVRVDVTLQDRMLEMMGGAMASVIVTEDPLRKAVSDSDLEKVRALAYTNDSLNEVDAARNSTLLAEAVERGNRNVVAALLDAGARVDVRNRWGRTALMFLSETSTPELVRDLIAAGAKLNSRDDSGDSPLMNAAGSGTSAVLAELIRAGARIDATNSAGETALFGAARSNSAEAVELLIDAGVNVNARNDEGQTALMTIAAVGSFEKIKTLIRRGAEISLINDDGRTALMLAAFNEDPRVSELLLNGSPIEARDNDGNTALLLAAERGSDKTVLLLIYAGAQIDARDKEGRTALLRAAISGQADNVKALLNAGADLTAKDNDGKSALTLALEADNKGVVSLLASRGAPE